MEIHAKRGQRRLDLMRMKARARLFYPHDPKARLANHLASCSCLICGNPRHHWGSVNMCERRMTAAWNAAINDV